MGLSICLRHEHLKASTLRCYFWPPLDQFQTPSAHFVNQNPRLLPLIHALVRWCQTRSSQCPKMTQALLDWAQAFARNRSSPWHSRLHLLVHLETGILATINTLMESAPEVSLKLVSNLDSGQEPVLGVIMEHLQLRSLQQNEGEQLELVKRGFQLLLGHVTTLKRSNLSILDSLVPIDWIFAPFLWQFQQVVAVSAEDEKVNQVLPYVRFLAETDIGQSLWQFTRDEFCDLSRLSYLMLAIVASLENSLGLGFGETTRAMQWLLHDVMDTCSVRQNRLQQLPLNLPSFFDIYCQYLVSFAAASYGSELLASLVLWPASLDAKYATTIWSEENLTALTCIGLHPVPGEGDQFPFSLKERFFGEEQQQQAAEDTLLRSMATCIFSGKITVQKHPFLALWAVHLLNRFIYSHDNRQSALFTKLSCMLRMWKEREIVALLLMYKRPNLERKSCDPYQYFDLYDQLPQSRELFYQKIMQ
ncbi:hypothetical protein Ciccas_000155 [Cichlidogyrus casuarinus]|uniref:RPAP1/MINIYO-like TPR repeats domain-containing protein n=1 Tax=Cichlidogyrus casuarinus TaxID=1844966 RepID=A0ABD2QNR1_9PLAT